jgi:hypothetical protein
LCCVGCGFNIAVAVDREAWWSKSKQFRWQELFMKLPFLICVVLSLVG